MRQLLIYQIAFLLIMSSCNFTSNNKSNYSLRDTVLKEHLLAIDSIPYFDTTDINYKFLKAYQNNDTAYLNQVKTNIDKEREYKRRWQSTDSCIHQRKVTDLDADEAYRFILTPAFCRSTINITVSKKADSINLHFIKYQFNYDTAASNN